MTEEDVVLRAADVRHRVKRLCAEASDAVLPGPVFEALSDAAAIREEARRAGLRQGLAKVAELLDQAAHVRRSIQRETHREIVALAMAAARQLVGAIVDAQPDLHERLVEKALARLQSPMTVVIRVAPDAEPIIAAARERLGRRSGIAHFEIATDARLQPGDIVVETDRGRLDARLDIQLEAMIDALLGGDTQ